MRLGLLGFPIQHSLSPSLYRELLGDELESYELLEFKKPEDVPTLDILGKRLDGLSITAPYKTHFISQVQIKNAIIKNLGVINTLAFTSQGVLGTNTDLLATQTILSRYKRSHANLRIILLGSGSMARMTRLIANDLGIEVWQFARSLGHDIAHLNLSDTEMDSPVLVINSCSRDFVFKGTLHPQMFFWDYNYKFSPHESTLPRTVSSYQDGQEMLKLQALAAIEFWKDANR